MPVGDDFVRSGRFTALSTLDDARRKLKLLRSGIESFHSLKHLSGTELCVVDQAGRAFLTGWTCSIGLSKLFGSRLTTPPARYTAIHGDSKLQLKDQLRA